ncbi:MAG: hypothetical protein IBJ03_15180 [Gemmatimonadaceae bacterium]|nr:hypothetical protein [Gemmatimonadaceae bacterium]
MTEDARTYLRHRFTHDATQLRERVAQMRKGTNIPGPDANTSQRMAEACDDVVTMLESLPQHSDPALTVESLLALVPQLEKRAQGAGVPPVRAVYMGAATRVKEVAAAEAKAASGADEDEADIGDDEEDEDDDA